MNLEELILEQLIKLKNERDRMHCVAYTEWKKALNAERVAEAKMQMLYNSYRDACDAITKYNASHKEKITMV